MNQLLEENTHGPSAANGPKFRATYQVGSTAGRSDSTMANTYLNVAFNSMIVTVVAADTTEAKVTDHVVNPGWQIVRRGTGPVLIITSS